MSLAFVADVHVGNHAKHGGPVTTGMNRRCWEALAVLDKAVGRARLLDAEIFNVLGDLVDTVKPLPQMLTEIRKRLAGGEKQQSVVLKGNHDMVSEMQGDHALGPLNLPACGIRVVEKPETWRWGGDKHELMYVPFRVGRASDWLGDAVHEAYNECKPFRKGQLRVLATHLGIKDGKTPPWLRDAPDSIDIDLLKAICADTKVTHVFAGNWHSRRAWVLEKPDLYVLQVGTLVPTGWDNEGLNGYGTLAMLDDKGKVTIEEIPGPRFVTVVPGEPMVGRTEDCQIYRHCKVSDPSQIAGETDWMRKLIEGGTVVAGEVTLDDKKVAEQAKQAAAAARSTETLDEALTGYVNEMPLPEGVDRAAVLRRAQDYLK